MSGAHHRGMMTSAECTAKATAASASAALLPEGLFRTHYEAMATDWAALAVTALAQEVMEAKIIARGTLSA